MRSGFKVGTLFGISIHVDWSVGMNIALGIAASRLFCNETGDGAAK